jgi:hypothetical protein
MHPLPCRAETFGRERLALTFHQDSPGDRNRFRGKPVETRLKLIELMATHCSTHDNSYVCLENPFSGKSDLTVLSLLEGCCPN